MARRYRKYYYKRRRNDFDNKLFVAAIIFLGTFWLIGELNRNAAQLLSFIIVGGLAVLLAVGGMALWKYQSNKRKMRALDITAVDTMDPLEFERFVEMLLKAQGFTRTRLTERYDYGVDIVAHKDGLTWGVQVKRYNNMVKAEAVRQVFTALTRYKCDRAMVVTNNVFSRPAKVLAADNNCVLVDRDELAGWILKFQQI